MNFQEVEKSIQFLLEWQERFSADLDAMKERQQAFEQSLQRMETGMGALRESQVAVMALYQKLVETVQELAVRQTTTDERRRAANERLDAFIALMERYIAGNGRHPAS